MKEMSGKHTQCPEIKSFLQIFLGSGGDSLSYHNGMMFTTKDRDNDKRRNQNCATRRESAWWFNNCAVYMSDLNGRYMSAIKWREWKNNRRSIEKVEMKIRPIQF